MRKYLKIMIILSISTIILIITGCTKKSSSKENAKKDLPQIRIGVDILKPFFILIGMEIMQELMQILRKKHVNVLDISPNS